MKLIRLKMEEKTGRRLTTGVDGSVRMCDVDGVGSEAGGAEPGSILGSLVNEVGSNSFGTSSVSPGFMASYSFFREWISISQVTRMDLSSEWRTMSDRSSLNCMLISSF